MRPKFTFAMNSTRFEHLLDMVALRVAPLAAAVCLVAPNALAQDASAASTPAGPTVK